jgi:uncharacterized protein (TIGR03067 family)
LAVVTIIALGIILGRSKGELSGQPGGPITGNGMDLETLQGEWVLISWQEGDMVMDTRKDLRFFVVKNNINFKDPPYTILGWATFTNDPTKSPPQFEATSHKGKTYKGVYELKGDKLKVYFSMAGRGWPKDFPSDGGSDYDLFILKRATAD